VCFLIALVAVVEPLRALVLVGIILICPLVLDIVLIVHVLGDLLSMTASLDGIVLIHSLRLCKLVYLATNEASEKFLGELVGDGLACTMLGLWIRSKDGKDAPSLRWWSSKSFMPSKEAAPPISS
jgi:hypothetical protein